VPDLFAWFLAGSDLGVMRVGKSGAPGADAVTASGTSRILVPAGYYTLRAGHSLSITVHFTKLLRARLEHWFRLVPVLP